MECKITIMNGDTLYYPVVVDGVKWKTERKSKPSELKFTLRRENILKFEEGNVVVFNVDGKDIFYGFIFVIEDDNEGNSDITCYDSLRYFKNKDSFSYIGWSANYLLGVIAQNYNLTVGTCDETLCPVDRDEDNATLFDCVLNNIDATLMQTGKLYVLWDNIGKLQINDISNLTIDNLLLDHETGKSYKYKSSIDSNTFNKIKLMYEDKDSGVTENYVQQDSSTMNKWGTLQKDEKVDNKEGVWDKAAAMLQLYNKPTKEIQLKDFIGDVRCRAGFSPVVRLVLRDQEICNYMLINKATHTFKDGEHLMDLDLCGNFMYS